MSCGSSPRLRGTDQQSGARGLEDRFIPAPAGNGGYTKSCIYCPAVHPRACGERLPRRTKKCWNGGSSPRLRGTDDRPGDQDGGRRFIPAPAGNGPRRVGCSKNPAVHPRACGERMSWHCSGSCSGGSSPRLRGTACHSGSGASSKRFIPAPAGNGSSLGTTVTRSPVHPRACGERCYCWVSNPSSHGSSPRLRGTG